MRSITAEDGPTVEWPAGVAPSSPAPDPAWAAFDPLPAALVVIRVDGIVLHVTPAAERLFGWSAADARGRILPIVPLEQHATALAYLADVARGAATGPVEHVRVCHDGTTREVELVGAALPGAPGVLVLAYTDISARKALERTVQAREDQYVRATESGGVGIWHWELPDGVLVGSPMYAKIIGHPPAAIAGGLPWFREHAHPEDLARFQAILRAHLDKRNPFIAELRFRGAEGQWRWIELAGLAERNAAGVPTRMTGTIRDITDRVEVDQVLRERESHLRILAEHAQDLVGLYEADGTIVFTSTSMTTLLGWDATQLTRRSLFALVHPDDEARVRGEHAQVLAGKDVTGVPVRLRHRDGTFRWFDLSARPVFDPRGQVGRFHVIARDVTERRAAEATRRELEQQLLQTQKMEAIGTLAGGIAHDFNNILGAIIGFTELARMDLPPDSEPAESLTHVLAASERAKRLVAQILAFSRRAPSEQLPLALAELVTETRSLLRATLPSSVQFVVTTEGDPGLVRGNSTQLQQVLLNLAGNAEHAMRPAGGTLTIEIARVSGAAPDEEWVRLAVTDTGAGIPADVAARAFEPFFTTKPVGEGSGMGLAVVHGIVTAHRGRITIGRAPAGGTIVEVLLPALARGTTVASATTTGRIHATPTPGARLMVVDDEPALVSALVRLGTRLGLRVTGFVSSSEALRKFAGTPHAYDILLTDQTMPGISGEELITYVRAIRPDLPVILCTGFSRTLSAERAAEIGVTAFLAKPVSAQQLAEALAAVTAPKP